MGGNPVLDLIAYHDPGLHTVIRVWYYAAPAVAVVLAGSVCLSVWRVWLQPPARGGGRGRLPAWPASPEDHAPSLVIGELHHPTVPRESERPSWLVIPEEGLYTGVGARVHLLPRTVRARARRHRHLRRRLVPGPRRGSLRRTPLHHPAGRERLGTGRARPRDPGHRTQGQPVQGPDPHPQRRGRSSEAGRRTGDGSQPGNPFARTRPAQAAHDTAVYRSCMKEKQRLLDRGAAVRRIRLDTELKSAVARGSEAARPSSRPRSGRGTRPPSR